MEVGEEARVQAKMVRGWEGEEGKRVGRSGGHRGYGGGVEGRRSGL